ncbi:hypothetical protein F5Y17DRAFT_187307 [Xylariaceae sp. FL0594]|nr:hypothetical protein F5Y17DRAFT_187307 [Xylariaceae sp. FL0594]
MPSKSTKNGVASTLSAPASTRFELPALDLKFGSLTDGTDIPPPPPSPKQEKPPPQPKQSEPQEKPEEKPKLEEKPPKEANGATNGTPPSKPDMTIQSNLGLKRSADEVPLSPALSSRGSLRRLISKTILNHAYDEQGSIPGQNHSRPPSRSASFVTEEKKARRSSGWFRRLRSHDHHSPHKNLHFEETKTSAGPPPPMIPELSALESKIDTRLGDDLFKGIGKDA